MGRKTRKYVPKRVFGLALERMMQVYEQGHRIVVAFSGGKDSTCTLELAIAAATMTNNLPVDVSIRDEEILWPGAYDYVDRVKARPECRVRHIVAHQPILNIYNRAKPFWWVFDQELDPSKHFRPMPSDAEVIPELHIASVVTRKRYPPPEGKDLITALGIRADESAVRRMGIFSMCGHISGGPTAKQRVIWPIYDWLSKDVWKAIKDNDWDYAKCYDDMARAGLKGNRLRVAPPTMGEVGLESLTIAARLWPKWFEDVCQRLPGVRAGVHYGRRAITARRNKGERWRDTFQRECMDNAPPWIAARAEAVMKYKLKKHQKHSTTPFPESRMCHLCGNGASWWALTAGMYNGDPFCTQGGQGVLKYVEPEFFRPHYKGTKKGKWMGKPSF